VVLLFIKVCEKNNLKKILIFVPKNFFESLLEQEEIFKNFSKVV